MTRLITAAEAGDIAAIERALAEGAEVNAQDERGRTAAMTATYARQTEAARVLFNHGANPNLRDDMLNSPFLYAGAEGLLDILKLAHEAGGDPAIPNRYGGVAIIPAAEHGHVDVVAFLLDHTSVNVNHINNLGWTALLEAIILNDGGPTQQEVIRLLIGGGADVNIADSEGVSPLTHAQQRGYAEIVALLQAAGARH